MSETIKEQRILSEKADNYNRIIISTFKNYFGNRILDCGCSIGNLTKYFINKKKLLELM